MSDLNTRINTPSSTPSRPQEQSPDHLKGTLGKIGESIENIASTAEVIEYAQEKPGTPAQTGGRQAKTGTQKPQAKRVQITQKFIPETPEAIKKELKIEIKKKILSLMQEARELEKSPGASFAFSLQKSLREIRKLNFQLSTLIHMTFDKLKEIYLSFFPNAVEKKDE